MPGVGSQRAAGTAIGDDYATRALRTLGIGEPAPGNCEEALDALSRSDALDSYWSSLWVAPDGLLGRRFGATMSSFLASQRESVRGYLRNDLGFQAVTDTFVRHALSVDLPPASVDVCLAELAPGREAVGTAVTGVLARCPLADTSLRILGFGADDCSFEEDIGRHATSHRSASGFVLYRWDPFAARHRRAIDIAPAQLRNPAFGDDIDVVACRWALHHVAPSARWGDLHWCLRRLRPGAHLVVVEEGDFADREEIAPAHRLYRFLVMSVDVVTNAALRPAWFTSTAPNIGADFHVDFLDGADLVEIERGFRHPFRRTVHPIRAGARFGQTLITWHVDH